MLHLVTNHQDASKIATRVVEQLTASKDSAIELGTLHGAANIGRKADLFKGSDRKAYLDAYDFADYQTRTAA
jgi:hypothetical protein